MGQNRDYQMYEKLLNGDEKALEALYDKYEKLLFSFAYKVTKDGELLIIRKFLLNQKWIAQYMSGYYRYLEN